MGGSARLGPPTTGYFQVTGRARPARMNDEVARPDPYELREGLAQPYGLGELVGGLGLVPPARPARILALFFNCF
ncbi:hypothetical protein PanWU01x14_022090 [Parasponia andersonii]|uniref:Uncharacterized protein n=1 Tax=Parasponia andersonii TaxID=3476 RepID=A0A2P5DY72_PARAD|nr:hypothetical protein PanWU01x14_022090 [Parasponia andersonii]